MSDSSVQFSGSLMSDSLQARELQHARLPCPSLSPGVCSHSCPLGGWTSYPLSPPSPPALNLSQQQGLFKWVSSSHQVSKGLEFQLQHQFFQWIFRTDFIYEGLIWSTCSSRDSQESSPTPQFKSISSTMPCFFIIQLSHPYIMTGKIMAFTRRNFIAKVCLCF